jgi:protein-S-isoprenylcysteine O-methyltransferase Ste14
MNFYSKWAKKEYKLAPRLLSTLLAGVLFIGLIPWLLIVIMPRLDERFLFPSLKFGVVNYVVGGILMFIGLFFGLWSNGSLLFEAQGTPLPVMPSKKLLAVGPFRYCRNPMSFGAISAYLGTGIFVGSLASLLLAILLGGLLIIYLKRVEEKELSERFGPEYLEYKSKTSFIIPNFGSRRKK